MVNDSKFYKTLLFIAIPVTLQGLLSVAVNLLDNIMVGSLMEASLAGVALANQFALIVAFLVRGATGGASLMIAQYWGKRDMARIKQVFAIVFQIMMVVVSIITIFAVARPDLMLSLFSAEADVIAQGSIFLRVVALSFIIFGVAETFAGMLRSVEIVKISLYATIASLLTNVFLNYTLIFGHFGAPRLGVLGAAWATVIARVVEFVIIMFYVLFKDTRIKLKPADLIKSQPELIKDFVKFGVPVMIGDVQWGLVGTVRWMIVGHLGKMMVAASSIADVAMSLGFAFSTGLSSAACVVIGKSVGEGDYAKTRAYSNTIQIMFAGVAVLLGAITFATRAIPVSFYNINPETAELARTFIAIGALSLIGTCYHAACFVGINRGAGDTQFVFIVDVICGWGIVVPFVALTSYLYLNNIPLFGSIYVTLPMIFLGTRIDQFFKWIIAFIRLRGNRWIRNVTR